MKLSNSLLLGPIVGGLSYKSANIWARAKSPATMYVWLGTSADLRDARRVGEAPLVSADGCAGVVTLEKLKAATKYFYAVSLRRVRPSPNEFHSFSTFPKPRSKKSFSFAFGSCYLPPDEHGGQTMDELYKRIKTDDLRFGVFLGDQIYADNIKQNGLGRVAVTVDEYRAVYEYAWSRPVMQKLLPDLPLFMTLDDHEVDDDWRWQDAERRWAHIPPLNQFRRWLAGLPPEQRNISPERVRAALKAYHEHQTMHAPEMMFPPEMNALGEFQFPKHDAGSLAYSFYVGGAAFFVMDTRTMRVKGEKKTLLGEGQWIALQEWLKKVKDDYPVKFIISSGTLLYPFWLDISHDRWEGFRDERERLLKFLATNEIEGVHILTGDIHSAHAVSAELNCPSGRRIPIFEFCATPFEQGGSWITNTYYPMRSPWLGKQKKIFYQRGQNFGVVHVDFESPTPVVSFTLHCNDGGWKTLPPVKA